MASDLLFFATIDEFDQIVSECHSCCDRSCEAERKLMSAIELTTGFLNKLKNYPGPYKWNYCPDFITDDELVDVELGTYLSIVSSLDGSNSRETALIARVSKMLADFSKAYEAQSGGGRTNNRASTSSASSATSGGCYIATCAYGFV